MDAGSPLSVASLASMVDKVAMRVGRAPDRLRMHPETKTRLILSKMGRYVGARGPEDFLMGIPAVIDASVREGIVRAEYDLAPSLEDSDGR